MTTKYYDKKDQKFVKFAWMDKDGVEERVTIKDDAIFILNSIENEVSIFIEDIPKLIWALKEAAKELNINIEEE